MIKMTRKNLLALAIGVSIPVYISLLIQINNILGHINPLFNVIFNLESFAMILLVFIGGMIVAIILNNGIKNGFSEGGLVGLFSGTIIIFLITICAVILDSNLTVKQLLTMDFFAYVICSLIFQIMTGAIGGVIGSIIMIFHSDVNKNI
jgi:Family of unknown function (DUF5518)